MHGGVTSESDHSAGFPGSPAQKRHSHAALQNQFTGSCNGRHSPLGSLSSLDVPPPGRTPVLLAQRSHMSRLPWVQRDRRNLDDYTSRFY